MVQIAAHSGLLVDLGNGRYAHANVMVDENGNPLTISAGAAWTPDSRMIITASVLAVNIRASAGRCGYVHVFNNLPDPYYFRLHDQVAAPAAADVATIKYRGMIPGSTGAAGVIIPIPDGIVFAAGIGIRVTGLPADNDNTNVPGTATAVVMVNTGHRAA